MPVSERAKLCVKTAALLLTVVCTINFIACNQPPDPRLSNFRVERGNVAAQYDEKTGRLTRIEVDANRNGKVDTWTYTDGPRIERIEIDRDEDNRIDRWEYYGADSKLEKVGSSTLGDGRVDEWAFQDAHGALARIETDTDRDGKVDKWTEYSPPSSAGGAPILRTVELDTERTGKPTQRLIYRGDGSLERVEKLAVHDAAPTAPKPQ